MRHPSRIDEAEFEPVRSIGENESKNDYDDDNDNDESNDEENLPLRNTPAQTLSDLHILQLKGRLNFIE